MCFLVFRCLGSWIWRSLERLLATFASPTWSIWLPRPRPLMVHTVQTFHTCTDNQSINDKNMYRFLGTKRVWMPDDVEAYIEVEVRELNGDKTTVETKDGRVRHQLSFTLNMFGLDFFFNCLIVFRCSVQQDLCSLHPKIKNSLIKCSSWHDLWLRWQTDLCFAFALLVIGVCFSFSLWKKRSCSQWTLRSLTW